MPPRRKKRFHARKKPVAHRRRPKPWSESIKSRLRYAGKPRSPLIPMSSNVNREPALGIVLPHSHDPLEENIFERVEMQAGYVFVPKGNVYITRHCRANTKASKKVVFVVYNNGGNRTLGIRVPREIYLNVSELDELTAKKRATAVEARDAKVMDRAREMFLAEFPLMPADELELVVKHAFLKGSGRVGRDNTITDKRKASLAVEAHIRHRHTPYEALLKSGVERQEARKQVEETAKAIKRTWRGVKEQETADVVVLPTVIEISSD